MDDVIVLLLFVAGAVAVGVGVWAVFPPAVWVGSGLLLLRAGSKAFAEAGK
jgi:hypothetical protein